MFSWRCSSGYLLFDPCLWVLTSGLLPRSSSDSVCLHLTAYPCTDMPFVIKRHLLNSKYLCRAFESQPSGPDYHTGFIYFVLASYVRLLPRSSSGRSHVGHWVWSLDCFHFRLMLKGINKKATFYLTSPSGLCQMKKKPWKFYPGKNKPQNNVK